MLTFCVIQQINWLLPPFLLFTLAFGGTIVPKLNIILNLICRNYISEQVNAHPGLTIAPVTFGKDNPQCQIPQVQARVARFTLYMSLIAGVLSAIISPQLGILSDRYGRKSVIAFTTIGFLVTETVTILIGSYPDQLSVNWFLAAATIEGLSGSFIATLAICHSYATDCTPPHERHVAFGRFHGCLFTGIALGPVLASYIIKWTGNVLSVFYGAIGALIIFVSFLILCIPESLSKERQQIVRNKLDSARAEIDYTSSWRPRLKQLNLIEPLKILFPRGPGTNKLVRRNLVLLALIDFCCFGVAMGSMTVVIIYSNYQFGWGSVESSMFLSVVNTCRVFCLIVVLPLLSKAFQGHNSSSNRRKHGSSVLDLNIVRFSILVDAFGYIGYAVSRSGPLFVLSGALAAVGGMSSPTLQSSLTKHVPFHQTGQLLGASGLLHAVARVLGPVVFNGIYSLTVASLPQTVFICLAATFILAHVLSWFVIPGG